MAPLSTHFGNSRVQVVDCSSKEFTDQKGVKISVAEFISYWIDYSELESSEDGCTKDQPILYLKDWHFVKEYDHYIAYSTPSFFLDDWLNLYHDTHSVRNYSKEEFDNDKRSCSDYRFVYVGQKGSWTPLHADVFRPYGWSANAIWLKCTQGENQIIFVPSGWYHQVHNMEDTISINHNWFNAYILSYVWNLRLGDYNEAVEYIEDARDICDDFEGLCQGNLCANKGMNFLDFFFFIMRISVANLILLHNLVRSTESPMCITKYLLTNLASLCKVASSMIDASAFTAANLHSLWAQSPYALTYSGSMLEETDFRDLCWGFSKTYRAINLHVKMMKLPVSVINRLVSDLSRTDAWNMQSLAAFECKLLDPKALISFINSALKDLRKQLLMKYHHLLNIMFNWFIGNLFVSAHLYCQQ